MKKLKKTFAIIMVVAMILSIDVYGIPAYAGTGIGTAEDVCVITTAEELQAVNDNLSGNYQLGADIDMSGKSFTPIGNVDVGAFMGAFDGNGYTIRNLNIDAGKYSGLFGYNSGTICNVTLENVHIIGSMYVGGVCAYSDENGQIENCSVLGKSSVTGEDGIGDMYAGGVCGSSVGTLVGPFTNKADIKATSAEEYHSYAGGIIGKDANNSIRDCGNYGKVNSNGYSGGIIAYGSEMITDSFNNGIIYGYDEYVGGIIGYNYGGSIKNCFNTGFVSGSGGTCCGGIASYCSSIINCFNSGCIGSGGRGIVYSGAEITNSYNSGALITGSNSIGGRESEIYNCYNCGPVSENYVGVAHYVSWSQHFKLSGSNTYELPYKNVSNTDNYRTIDELQDVSTYKGWDFDDIWTMSSDVNGGLPYLKNVSPVLFMSKPIVSAEVGSKIKLDALRNGSVDNSVSWITTYGNSSVDRYGNVIIGDGLSSITAIDSEGNKANCSIYGITVSGGISAENFSMNCGKSSVYKITAVNPNSNDYIESVTSSDTAVVKVSPAGGMYINATAASMGTATLTMKSAGGKKCTCNVTVTDDPEELSLNNSSMSVARGATKAITATITPSAANKNITWSSSDESVATVDRNGNVTGVKTGSAVITAETVNGLRKTCDVTVTAPVNAMAFDQQTYYVYKDDTVQLNLIKEPVDSTDSISYSCSSSTSYITVNSSTGKVTGKSTGTYTVTATSSSGIKATCSVKVINYPVIVTGISLDKSEYEMKTGEVFKLNATVSPSNADDKTILWESTDETVASVSETGTVSAVGAGKTLITATTSNGIIAYCTVNVTGVASTNLSRIYIPDMGDTGEEYMDIPVMIENNPGINFASITVIYDSSAMEPEEVSNGVIFDQVVGSTDKEKSSVKLTFLSSDNRSANGILAKIRFHLNESYTTSSLKVCYYPGEIRSQEGKKVAFNLSDGRLTSSGCRHTSTVLVGAKDATCEKDGHTGDTVCRSCEAVLENGLTIAALGHDWAEEWTVDRSATFYKSGEKSLKCSRCTACTDVIEIPMIKSVALKTTSYTYDGKIKTPRVAVIDSNGAVIDSESYIVSMSSGRKNIGSYKVTVAFKGNYSGSKTMTFKINPKKTYIKSLNAVKKGFTVKWSKKAYTGYQLRYSLKSSMASSKTVTISNASTISKKVTKIKAKKRYYVQVRTYKTVKGVKYYSVWSTKKNVKTR